MTVHVERDVALVVARDALAAVEHLDEVGEEPDEGCRIICGTTLSTMVPLILKISEMKASRLWDISFGLSRKTCAGDPESVMRPVQGASHSTVHPTGRARGKSA